MKIELSPEIQKFLAVTCLVIGFLGIALRLSNINQSVFFFYDEGYYLNYNKQVVQLINAHPPAGFTEFRKALYALLRFSLNTGKSLWFLIVDARAFWGAMTDWAYPRFISAIAGSLTLGGVYLLARRLYDSRLVGILSVVILAVLPSHVFYSRLALQESLSTLFFIFGFYFYLFPKQFGWRTFLSALFFVCVFFTNYRLIMIPGFVLLLECVLWLDSKEKINIRKFIWHTVTFVGLIILIGSIDEGQNARITFSWMFHQADLAKGKFEFFNLLSYSYYIFKLENVLFGCAFFANIYYLFRKEYKKAFPFLLVAAMIGLFSLVEERAARYLCVGLPFMVIAVASIIVYCLNVFQDRRVQIVLCAATLLMIGTLIPKSYKIANSKSDYQTAITFLTKQDPNAKILSSQNWVQNLFVDRKENVKEIPKSFARLIELYAKGYKYMIIDPQAYVSFTDSKIKFDPPLTNYLGFVTTQIRPDMIFPHFNDVILERFVFEHNESLRTSLKFLNTKDQGYDLLKIYDIKKCIIIIKSRFSARQIKEFEQLEGVK